MRLHFPNTVRPKRAAKHLAAELSVPLSSAQRAIAHGCGFRDWHELEREIASGPPCPLDQSLSSETFVTRQRDLTLAIAHDLGAFDGDVQYALSTARLTGDRLPQLAEQIAIRTACWRATDLPVASVRQKGAVGEFRPDGGKAKSKTVILRSFGFLTEVIRHSSILTIAASEYVSPRQPGALFIPMRLYLPYGYWNELDGARVLFSRDYHPLWRLRENMAPERVEPWTRIKFNNQAHLWDDGLAPWEAPMLETTLIELLAKSGVHQLPILADALPLLVHTDQTHCRMADGARLLQARRTSSTDRRKTSARELSQAQPSIQPN
jgi:hypothetical protein